MDHGGGGAGGIDGNADGAKTQANGFLELEFRIYGPTDEIDFQDPNANGTNLDIGRKRTSQLITFVSVCVSLSTIGN